RLPIRIRRLCRHGPVARRLSRRFRLSPALRGRHRTREYHGHVTFRPCLATAHRSPFWQRYVVSIMIHGAEIRELRAELGRRGLFEPRAVFTSIKLLSMLTVLAALTAAVILLPL